MLKAGYLVIVCAFVLWIIPLGVFIKPSQEKKVCGGQRAICLCAKMVKPDGDAGKKIVLVQVNSLKEEPPPPGYGGNFLAHEDGNRYSLLRFKLVTSSAYLYSLTISRSIDHVPKV